jgi:hypothetical protein
MAIVTIILGAVLMLAAFASLWASLNLVPTEMGLLYGVSGVILLGCGAIVLAIAALITRIGRVAPPPAIVAGPPPTPEVAVTYSGAPKIEIDESPAQATVPAPPALLARASPDQGPASGRASPQVIGRYAAGASSYVLFSDGSIEAETDTGAMRFATLDDFKSYVANHKR